MNKRGQGVQFNWIFVIVAGAIILGFFVMFIFKFVELQEKRQDVQTVRFFSTGVISASSKLQIGSGGAAVDSKSDDGIRFGYNTNLGYECIDGDASVLINRGESAWYKLKDEIVFMDREIRFGALDGVDLWILPWSYPYHITNFIYLANSKTKIYLVYDSSGREIADNLEISSVFNVESVPIENFDNAESGSKAVFFTRNEPNLDLLSRLSAGKSINFVYIAGNKAKFFDEGWSNAVEFYGEEQLYGAIFSNNADIFECNINRALERTKNVGKIYSERARAVSQIDRREGCNYAPVVAGLNAYITGNINENTKVGLERLNLIGGCVWVF